MAIRRLASVAVFALGLQACLAQGRPEAAAIEAYLQPYVQSGNFSGAVVVEKNGKSILDRGYGFADREQRVFNTGSTRFHIASISMQFTAAAVLRLVDKGSITLDDHIGSFVPGIEEGDRITIRDLLTERSGLPDINSLPDYNEVLQHHQTAASLVGKIKGQPLLFEPGSQFLREEHSAYNLLALVVEKKTGLPFKKAVHRLVFDPLELNASMIDDDSDAPDANIAKGYEPHGASGVRPATAIHWSSKTGNASVYTTASDEERWVRLLFDGDALSARSRNAILDTSIRVGYGWLKGENKRFGQTAYYMNGRAPGFASFVLYLPKTQTLVVVFSNVYSSATTTIGYDVAAILLGLPYSPFRVRDPAPTAAELKTCVGTFQFGSDFYQPNAEVTLIADGELSLHWSSGEISPLIPIAKDQYLDRSYWEEAKIERDASGSPAVLHYGQFEGKALKREESAKP
jgi:CubicO group peptidase (beta-lactamase class C family)